MEPNNYPVLNSDPTHKFQKQIKNAITESFLIASHTKPKLIIKKTHTPQLYSLIKIHKPDAPIRPVVSFYTAPSYNLSKHLIKLLNYHAKFNFSFSIKNSFQLVEKIQNIQLPTNAKLASFDIKNLFPSVPPYETLKIIKNI